MLTVVDMLPGVVSAPYVFGCRRLLCAAMFGAIAMFVVLPTRITYNFACLQPAQCLLPGCYTRAELRKHVEREEGEGSAGGRWEGGTQSKENRR